MSQQSNGRDLQGMVVLVTGASAGIGEATARAFAAAGACVILAARRAERLHKLAAEIGRAGGQAFVAPTDLQDQGQISRLVRQSLDRYGRIDVLANIAGWGKYDWIDDTSAEDLRRHFDVNVIGLAELTRQVVPVMQRQRSGHILNMSSYSSRIAFPPMTLYAASKYAVEGFSDGLRRELAPWGIHVTRIHPSGVKGTEFNKKSDRRGGVSVDFLALGRLSRERVANELVRLVLQPRRSLYLGRLLDAAVLANRLVPALVDAAASLYIRQKRRRELAARPNVRRLTSRDSQDWEPAELPAPNGALALTDHLDAEPTRAARPVAAALLTGGVLLGALWQMRGGRSR